MCLSEPQAGSSLADITTRAEPQPDGSYRLFGNKMWISAGDHELAENIVHLVLAKIPGGPAGVKGISLFIVPKLLPGSGDDAAPAGPNDSAGIRNDVVLAGLNHKMGYRGTTNCLLNFGEGAHRPGGQPGAVGYLVGEPHSGLAAMFHMMNEARIGVGLGATALGYTGYLHALDYARTRPQGRPVGDRDASQPQLADHRASGRPAHAAGPEGLCRRRIGARAVLLQAGRRSAHRRAPRPTAIAPALLLDVLTPIAKSLAVPVVPGRQRPGDPGARRLRLRPRLPGRAVLPGQPAEPDPRGHPRHPGAGPARPQGDACTAGPA